MSFNIYYYSIWKGSFCLLFLFICCFGCGSVIGVYYFFQDPPVGLSKVGEGGGATDEMSKEAIERVQVTHWLEKKRLS